jgi:hypothetical protein
MPTLYHYTPLSPLREEYRDDGSEVILSIPCQIKGSRLSEICLLGTDQTIYAIRITIPALTEKIVSEEDQRKITGLCEHMLGVLRLTYDLDADFIRFGDSHIQMTSFSDEGQKPNFQMKIWHEVFQGYKIDLANVSAVFCETAKLKEVVRLCADALHSTLPLQYRYLTLYKLFERDFRKNRQWQKSDFGQLLTPFEEEFRALKVSEMKLFNFIIHLRDKCAHIAVGGEDSPGILGLESPDAQLVEKFMPLFWKIARQHINQKYSGVLDVSLFPRVPPQRVD